jgi:hypothetical protein
VERILAAKWHDPKADTTALEREIDQLVYQLYELTPEEIAIVEEATRGKTGLCILAVDKPWPAANNSGRPPGSSFGEPGAKPPQGGFCVLPHENQRLH